MLAGAVGIAEELDRRQAGAEHEVVGRCLGVRSRTPACHRLFEPQGCRLTSCLASVMES